MPYLRAVALIVFITAIAAAMVAMRQQRTQVESDIARMHAQIHQTRQSLWEVQTRAAKQLKPEAIEHRLEVGGLELEPIRSRATADDGDTFTPRLAAMRADTEPRP